MLNLKSTALKQMMNWLAWALVGALFLWWPLHVDFYSDEGYFSEMTARVLRGELPNLEFASNYLGLFYFYNAFWFQWLGLSFSSLRMGMLVMTSVLFVPVLYQLAIRMMPRFWAVLATLLVLTVALGTNTSVTANWYALYFALAALLSVWCWLVANNQSRLLLMLAGLLLGIAFLMKHTTAIYTGFSLVSGLLVWLLYLPAQTNPSRRSMIAGQILAALFLMVLPAYALLLVSGRLDMVRLGFYVLPVFAVAAALGWRLFKKKNTLAFGLFAKYCLWLACGFGIPLLLYAVPYVIHGGPVAVWLLVKAVFVDYPKIYLQGAFLDYFSIVDSPLFLTSVLVMLWLILSAFLAVQKRYSAIWVFAGGLLMIGMTSGSVRTWVNVSNLLMLQLPMWAILGGGVWFFRTLKQSDASAVMPLRQWIGLQMWLLGVFLFLGTYPLGMQFYFSYTVTPFLLWGMYCLATYTTTAKRSLQMIAMVFVGYWIFLGGLMAYRQVGWYNSPTEPMFPAVTFPQYLDWPEGGIYVAHTMDYGERALMYKRYIEKISKRPDDVFMYSDGPEVYFITRHINPTRYSYAIDGRLSDGRDVVAGLEKHQTQYVFFDVTQNHFEQPVVHEYLNRHFVLKEKLDYNVLVFERKK